MTYEEMEAKVAEQKKAVIELNKRIILRLNELGLKEFHFSDFYGDGECSWCDEEIDSDICIDESDCDFRYWIANMPIRYESICIDLRAIKIVGDTILYCLEWYSETYKGTFNEEAYFVNFEELLNMIQDDNFENIHRLLETILRSLSDDDYYGLLETNKEYFIREVL